MPGTADRRVTPDPRLGRAKFSDLVSIVADTCGRRFWDFFRAGLIFAVPEALAGAKLQHSVFAAISRYSDSGSFRDLFWIHGVPALFVVLLFLFFKYIVRPVVESVMVRSVVEELSGRHRRLTEVSDELPWGRSIGIEILRNAVSWISLLLPIGIWMLSLTGAFPLTTGGNRILAVLGVLVTGMGALIAAFAGSFILYSRFGIALAFAPADHPGVSGALAESWKWTAGKEGQPYLERPWMRLTLLFMAMTAFIWGITLAASTLSGVIAPVSYGSPGSQDADSMMKQLGSIGLIPLLITSLILMPVRAIEVALSAVAEGVFYTDLELRRRPNAGEPPDTPATPADPSSPSFEMPPIPGSFTGGGFIPSA